ncbi:hypothetical protein Hanom_Chr13g01244441 [Helianthus anomalus]
MAKCLPKRKEKRGKIQTSVEPLDKQHQVSCCRFVCWPKHCTLRFYEHHPRCMI